MRQLADDTSGAVYVEFLIAFIPLFFLFLGVVQLALMFPARMVVQHAAYRAVRTAAVVLDDDPAYYGGEIRGSLQGSPLTAGDLATTLTALSSGGSTGTADLGLSRRATIELAAATVLAPLAPRASGSIRAALDRAALQDAAAATRAALRVSVFTAGGAPDAEPSQIGGQEDVTVHVEYDFTCAVPIIAALICHDGKRTLTAEARLQNQGASYPYFSQLRSTSP